MLLSVITRMQYRNMVEDDDLESYLKEQSRVDKSMVSLAASHRKLTETHRNTILTTRFMSQNKVTKYESTVTAL